MRKYIIFTFLISLFVAAGCSKKQPNMQSSKKADNYITTATADKVKKLLTDSLGTDQEFRINRGVEQAASLWREQDGTQADFEAFCRENFVADTAALYTLFTQLERGFEILRGEYHRIDLRLKETMHLDGPEISPVDMMFGSYDASAHLTDDLYTNKIAFITALNFPYYTLEEKTAQGESWSRRQWAYARMGDKFTSRVPADVLQQVSSTLTAADAYISEYNIFMDRLATDQGAKLFPEGLKLITHWGLRDELKSNYPAENGLEKQRMIYQVMKRIIDQSIPAEVINKGDYDWNPYSNQLTKDGKQTEGTPEATKRYQVLLENFKAMQSMDAYEPHMPDYIQRAFEGGMEIPQEDVERLFTEFVSSPQVKEVAAYISERLGRPLEPFDIWYDGFKPRSTVSEEMLTARTRQKYPDPKALEADLPNILVKLGWAPDKAKSIASLITVDPSRGAGHAWGAEMRNDLAHLRTRVGPEGMDYKGYNIAVHEFGHTVEQTVTMNDVDYYTLNGVPNTAFTEAVAFLFQKRDLELLGINNPDPTKDHLQALDNFWGSYEIMGVSLVDMKVWKWMYENPKATPEQVKEAVISAAKEVWNKYYAGILGGNDEPILGIYSHMIDNPLYLANYPMGHLIEFQVEQQVKGKPLAQEFDRMYTQGRLVPQIWMKNAVGREISTEPLIQASKEALTALRKGKQIAGR